MLPAYQFLQNTLNQYHVIPHHAWQKYLACCSIKQINKGDIVYAIDATVTQGLLADTKASVLAYLINGEIAGTAISYQSGDTLGVHQLGTIPSYRKKGVAAHLMRYLLAQALHRNSRYVTLPASQAGLPLYEKLGFQALAQLSSVVRV